MPVTISGGIFNFTTGGYIPPTWSGSETYAFGNAYPTTYQIYSDGTFIYAAVNYGLTIYDQASELTYAYITFPGGFNTVGGNSERIYVGTPNDGIKYINKTCISGSISGAYLLNTCLTDLSTTDITSSGIKYLHVNNNNLLVCTNSGVDYFRYGINPYIHSKTFVAGAQKCFATNNSMYYTISGTNPTTSGIEYSLNRLDTCLTDWNTPTKTYTTGSGIFVSGIKINDIYVTQDTAAYGGNTIFCATSSGTYVIDEDNNKYAIYYTR